MSRNHQFMLRVRYRGRYPYLLAASLSRMGAQVYLFDRDASRNIRERELTYYNYAFDEDRIQHTAILKPTSLANQMVLIDSIMDGQALDLPWRNVLYFSDLKNVTHLKFHPEVQNYLAFGFHPDDRQIAAQTGKNLWVCPFWSHPNIFRAGARTPCPSSVRRIHLLLSATSEPEKRLKAIEHIRNRFKDEVFFWDMTEADSQKWEHIPTEQRLFMFSSRRWVDFCSWLDLLGATRWCMDLPGYGLRTHRVVEACMMGCAPLLHEESAAAYTPPFQDGVDCITYSDTTITEVIQKIMHADDKMQQQIAIRARQRYCTTMDTSAVYQTILRAVGLE